MIHEYLIKQQRINKLHNSYLINVDELDRGKYDLEEFILEFLQISDIKNSDDYITVEKLETKSKNISVDQIRNMQKFLYKTSVISGKKIAVIYGADQMNLNAANSCLKVLEDTPKNTYIFLLTNNAASILPTIRSRCAKINHQYHKDNSESVNQDFVKGLLNTTSPGDKQKFIEQFGAKDRDLWHDFAKTAELLIAKLCKNQASTSFNALTDNEASLLRQMNSYSLSYLQIKYNKIINIINDVGTYDLDLRAACVMIIEQFRH
ncbi:MAG: hypothetical protein DGJ47_000216 [Rickettsiaceae bacterium]